MTGAGAARGGYDPATNEPYVGHVRPYVAGGQSPPSGSAYPSSEPPFRPGDSLYPSGESLFPSGASLYPSGESLYPSGQPFYPSDDSPYPPSPVGPGSSAAGRYPARPRRRLTADDEGASYVAGRPGHHLAEDLAEQRRRELPTAKEAEQAEDARRRVMPLWQELPLLLVVSLCVAVLVRSFFVQAFMIPSSSMEDLLRRGDRVLVSKIVYDTREPRRGEVIVFRGTDRWAPANVDAAPGSLLDRIGDTLGDLVGISRPGDKDFIKRIIGLPGDRVACCDELGRVTVNGVGVDEPYLSSNNPLETTPIPGLCGARRFAEVVVPPGELFVMGDNRAVSQDSRCQGTVPIENVIGRAFVLVWPPSRWSGIGVPDSFAHVPPPS